MDVSKRWAIVRATPELLVDLLKPGKREAYEIVDSPVPSDAVFVGAFFDEPKQLWMIKIASESFDEVPEGASLPVIDKSPVFSWECESVTNNATGVELKWMYRDG